MTKHTFVIVGAGLAGARAAEALRGDGFDGRAPQLWLIPPGLDPQPLGLLDPTRPVTFAIPPRLLPQATRDAVLAVSLEPPGGSPTGRPTGPVVAQGPLTDL